MILTVCDSKLSKVDMLLTVVHSSLATMEADSLWRMVVMNRPASSMSYLLWYYLVQ